MVEDGDLEPGQIEAAIQEEGAGGLRDWEQKAPGPRPVPFVLDDFLNSVGLGTDSVHDKEGDMKQKEFLDRRTECWRSFVKITPVSSGPGPRIMKPCRPLRQRPHCQAETAELAVVEGLGQEWWIDLINKFFSVYL